MKISSLKDITDENLKEAKANDIAQFIYDEVKKGGEQWVADKSKTEKALADAQASLSALEKSNAELKKQVDALAAEKAEKDRVDKFNARMSEMTLAYELDEEVREVIVADIKAIASDEDFDKYKKKAAVLFKTLAKKAKKDKKDNEPDNDGGNDDNDSNASKKKESGHDEEIGAKKKSKADDEDSMAKKKAKASESMASVVDDVVDNAGVEKGGLPNSSETQQKSLKEKFATAFAMDKFVVSKR